MTGTCGLIWLSIGNVSVSPCIRLGWSKQYRALSWTTYGTCHLTELVIFSIFDDHVDSAKCCAMESWLSSFPNHTNFKPGRPVFPVDLMVPNPRLDSSVGPKAGWYSTSLMQMVPGFRNMLMNEMQTRSMWEWRSSVQLKDSEWPCTAMYQGYPRKFQPGDGTSVPRGYTYCGNGSSRSL